MRDRSLTIASVANGFPPALGGAQIYNVEYARHLQARGHRVRVFTWDGAGEHVRRFDWRHAARDLEAALRAAAATSR